MPEHGMTDRKDFQRRRAEVLTDVHDLAVRLAGGLNVINGRDGGSWFVVRDKGKLPLAVKVQFAGTWADLQSKEPADV